MSEKPVTTSIPAEMFSDKYHEAAMRAEQDVCTICGRDVTNGFLVRVVNGGESIVHKDHHKEYPRDEEDMGYYPIGSNCAKRFVDSDYLITLEN